MYIASVSIENYKSFADQTPVEFVPGVNVVVGENNTGKTSLIEATSLTFTNRPHRSQKTFRPPYTYPPQESAVTIRYAMSAQELSDALTSISPFTYSAPANNAFQPDLLRPLPTENIFICEYVVGTPAQPGLRIRRAHLEHVPPALSQQGVALQQFSARWKDGLMERTSMGTRDYGMALADLARSATYAFKAERYNLGTSAAGENRVLEPSAANLAEVLSLIQPHPAQWDQFNYYVRLVFPQLHAISVVPIQQNRVQIQIWNENPAGLPQELAVSLAESGTGVGQVLSILAVVLTADYPRTIIIDEPQSFLHPGALRTLMQILANHAQHQFIIATHSPVVITASRPARVLRVTRPECETRVETLNPEDNDDLRTFLGDIGARISDVFGAEQILWVDGATEETCFPEIMRASKPQSLYSTKILAVEHTGDFDRNRRMLIEIYERLSRAGGLLPPAVGFLFDREMRHETEIKDLVRQGQGKIDFLDRRMFENYLLNPAAIANVMSTCANFREPAVTEEEIANWISKHGNQKRFGASKGGDVGAAKWLAEVDAAALLTAMFEDFSEARWTYKKVQHGLALTRFLLENAPNTFEEIVLRIGKLLEKKKSTADGDASSAS